MHVGASAEQPAAEVLDVRPRGPSVGHPWRRTMRFTRAFATTALTTGALALSAVIAPSAAADAHDDHKGWAGLPTVVLNPHLVPVLVHTLGVAPIAPGELS